MEVGGFSPITIGHPTYGCSRLNIAENNTPIVSDRIYTSYRHFHNSTEVDIFSTAPFGGRNSVDIDTITIGIERMLTEQNSIELRVPINRQLTSDIGINIATGPIASLPINDLNASLGNTALTFKHSMIESAGVVYFKWCVTKHANCTKRKCSISPG